MLNYDCLLRTEQIGFGRKTDEIAKISIFDGKRNSQFWTKFGRKTRQEAKLSLG